MDFDNFTVNSSDFEGNETIEDYFGPKRDPLYIVIPISIIYTLIFLTGLIGNISTCVVIARNKFMHTATNYYLFSLAVSDLLLLVTGLPQEMYIIWSRYPYVFGYTFCLLRGLFAETSSNATVLTISAFTIERYVAICHPFLSHTMAKLSRVIKLIVAIWIVSVCFAIPLALQLGIYKHVINNEEIPTCTVVREFYQHSFEVSTFMFFCAPMIMITILYVLIGIRLKHSVNIGRKGSEDSKKSIGSSFVNSNRRVSGKHQASSSSKRVPKMLVAVVVAFFLCWAPFHAQRLYAIYVTPSDEETDSRSQYLKIYEVMTYVSGVLHYLSTTINPLLYNIMSNKFREAFKETFARCCCSSQNRRPLRTYSILSRSLHRGVESTDSGRDFPSAHTNSTMYHKNSLESNSSLYASRSKFNRASLDRQISETERLAPLFSGNKSRHDARFNAAERLNQETADAHIKLVPLPLQPASPTSKLTKFVQLFQCLAKKTLDDGRKIAASPTGDSAAIELQRDVRKDKNLAKPGDISNSSLKRIDDDALREELVTYMLEER